MKFRIVLLALTLSSSFVTAANLAETQTAKSNLAFLNAGEFDINVKVYSDAAKCMKTLLTGIVTSDRSMFAEVPFDAPVTLEVASGESPIGQDSSGKLGLTFVPKKGFQYEVFARFVLTELQASVRKFVVSKGERVYSPVKIVKRKLIKPWYSHGIGNCDTLAKSETDYLNS